MTTSAPFAFNTTSRVGTLRLKNTDIGPDGKLDAAGRERIRKQILEHADVDRLPPAERENALAHIDVLLGQLGVDGVRATSAKTVVDTIEQAMGMMQGLGDAIESLGLTAATKLQTFELGAAGAMISAGRALIETGAMRLDHAMHCDCGRPSSHNDDASESETIPPPAPGPEAA
jgi:hypothetical protein